jgi:lipoprotein-anchoring transpeptidase ErfK/SrfK
VKGGETVGNGYALWKGEGNSMNRAVLPKVIAAVTAGLLLMSGAGAVLWSDKVAGQAANTYHQKRQALNARLQAAAQQGYTSQDLEPIRTQVRALDRSEEPWWIPGRPGYFDHLAAQTTALQGELNSLLQQLFTQAQTDAGKQIDGARAQIAQAQQANAADSDVQSLQHRLDDAARGQGAAHTIKDYRAVAQQAHLLVNDATALVSQVRQENQAIQQAAQQLVAQNAGNLGAVQQAGKDAVANGRNDASVAAYMNKPSPFKGYEAIQRAYSRLEKFAGLIGSGDVNQAAVGTAGVQRFAAAIHDGLIGGLPPQAVLVSFQSQRLWAYQDSKVVLDTLVTTGIRGVTDYGTDFGPMKVLYKEHPHKMQSPWPKSSPLWYPDTVVQWTTFFTWTGESIHDANWEPDSLLGPGSQYNSSTRSHGCIHVPLSDAEWMYNWAPIGTPVIVYPGDGSAVANQLSQITTDDKGTPRSA